MRRKATSLPDFTKTTGSASLRTLSDTGRVAVVEMSTDEWIAMRGHPRQRNTQRHASAAHWKLAKRATGAVQESLRQVAAAERDGEYFKVDGHTRAYLWESGELPAPGSVYVTVYRVQGAEELDALYTTFDAQSAAETNFDKVYGAFRECGLELKSKRLKHGFLVSALNIALRGKTRSNQDKRRTEPIDIYRAVKTFRREFVLLDSVDPQPEVFYSGVVAAGLIALTLDPEGIEYFRKLSAREGNKRDGKMDPIEAVLTYVESIRQQRTSWFHAQQEDLCARTLTAFNAWLEHEPKDAGHWFKSKVRALDLAPRVAMVKKKKGIAHDPYL